MRDQFLFINGILTMPGNSRAWTDKAVQWFNRNAPENAVSDKFEYYSPALLRRLYQDGHAADLAEVISEYAGARIHLVAHSNGCDLIARALRPTSTQIHTIHLISAALERDFELNGMGERITRGQIHRIYCLCSKGDKVLGVLARATQVATLGLLGYGDLGCRGAKKPVPPRVHHYWRDTMGHSDWFNPSNFTTTMDEILTQAMHAE